MAMPVHTPGSHGKPGDPDYTPPVPDPKTIPAVPAIPALPTSALATAAATLLQQLTGADLYHQLPGTQRANYDRYAAGTVAPAVLAAQEALLDTLAAAAGAQGVALAGTDQVAAAQWTVVQAWLVGAKATLPTA